MKKIVILLIILVGLVSCTRDANIASYNLNKEADQFRVMRRIVFYNSITDTYMFELIANCSIKKDNIDNQLEVMVKTGPGTFKKHYLGLSDNVTYMVEQIEYSEVSKYRYELIFKPKSILPFTIGGE